MYVYSLRSTPTHIHHIRTHTREHARFIAWRKIPGTINLANINTAPEEAKLKKVGEYIRAQAETELAREARL